MGDTTGKLNWRERFLDLVENHQLIRRTLLVWYMVMLSAMMGVMIYQFLNEPSAITDPVATIYTAAFTWVAAIGAIYNYRRSIEKCSQQ